MPSGSNMSVFGMPLASTVVACSNGKITLLPYCSFPAINNRKTARST